MKRNPRRVEMEVRLHSVPLRLYSDSNPTLFHSAIHSYSLSKQYFIEISLKNQIKTSKEGIVSKGLENG